MKFGALGLPWKLNEALQAQASGWSSVWLHWCKSVVKWRWYYDIDTRRRTALLCCGKTERLEIKPKRSFKWRTKNAVLWWWTWSTRCSKSSFDSFLFWPRWVDLYRYRNRNFHQLLWIHFSISERLVCNTLAGRKITNKSHLELEW